MFSDRFLDHFENPRNVGEIEGADAEAEDENPVCGDRLRVWLRLDRSIVTEVGWRAEGCAAAIAAASAMSELVKGQSVDAALALTREAVTEALGGLPARKNHAAMLAVSTLRRALAS